MNTIDKKCPGNVQPKVPEDPGENTGVIPAARHPLDGSQFHNVIEEQVYSELPPTPEEQMPRRAQHLTDPEPSPPPPPPEKPAISVGPS